MGVIGCKAETRSEAIQALLYSLASRPDSWRSLLGRKEELRRLLDYLGQPPMGTLVILGPQNCGKSAILKELTRLFATTEVLVVTAPVIYIDCRRWNFGVPMDAARAMRDALSGYLSTLSSVLKTLAFSFPGITISAAEAIRDAQGELKEASNVLQMVSIFQSYFKNRNPMARPTLILDEAQCLSEWPAEDRNRFFKIFTSMTKQDHQAHLILCSSDSFFVNWLEGFFPITTWSAMGISYLDENAARHFFETKLAVSEFQVAEFVDLEWNDIVEAEASRSKPDIPKITDEQWQLVFGLCGGCPQELQYLAIHIRDAGGIDKEQCLVDGMKKLQQQALGLVAKGLNPPDDAGWSGEDYEAVTNLIKETGYVDFRTLAQKGFKGRLTDKQIPEAVRAMVSGNVLHIRFVRGIEYNDMAGLPEVRHKYQAMAVSPSHLDAIRRSSADKSILEVELF